MSNKKLILPIYIFVELVYFFAYSTSMKSSNEPLENQLFIPVWIICGLINTYFVVYGIIPNDIKKKLNSKNIFLKTIFYLIILSVGFLITNGPVELIF